MLPLLELNCLPIRYIHSSWLEDMPGGGMVSRLRTCKRVEHRLSQYILKHLGLAGRYCYELPEQLEKLALLEPLDMLSLVRYTGVSMYSDELRQCINGSEVRAIKKVIGEDAYLFGLKRAPYMVQNLELPKVDASKGSLSERIWISGMRCLGSALAELKPALQRRVLLKLPSQWAAEAFQRKVPDNDGSAQLINKVYLEVTQS